MPQENPIVDFTNTEVAFKDRNNMELKRMYYLFKVMNNPALVNVGSRLALFGIRINFPLVNWLIRKTIFDHFCGGENLHDCQSRIDRLAAYNIQTILDYGAERKSSEEEFDQTLAETLRALEFASNNKSVPCISTKMTGMADIDLLEKVQSGKELTSEETVAFEKFKGRLETIGKKAFDTGMAVYVDAEESWIQDPIDALLDDLMAEFNKKRASLFNTVQLYRHDRLDFFYKSHERARQGKYILGMKLVRGAYMDKERERAEELGYPSPIHEDKPAVDKDYNEAVRYCVEHYETIASCNASHNWASNALQAQLIDDRGILKNHPHLNFCQLYGMSDNITFNLADQGYNVAKYLPYGPVKEVISYLIRRAEENTSVSGDMSRELRLLAEEMKRRKKKELKMGKRQREEIQS
ncbi:MAG: proline dehydrogenase family protein [Saprospiraceae bacterium]|nr:proline dehydrogenase family protein [Saprospiraceae bacterium]